MFFFGLGTIPMLLAIGLFGRFFPVALRLRLLKLVPVSVFVLAILLAVSTLTTKQHFLADVVAGKAVPSGPYS